MNKPNNVIDFESRRASRLKAAEEESGSGRVLDMTERRNEMLTHERRRVRRTILSEFIGASVVIPGRGLQKVAIYDISESGVAFDLDLKCGQFTADEEIAMRVYMTHKSYFHFVIKVANVRVVSEEGVTRHGCNFVKGTVNDAALVHFIRFIETVSASLQTDNGDIIVSNVMR